MIIINPKKREVTFTHVVGFDELLDAVVTAGYFDPETIIEKSDKEKLDIVSDIAQIIDETFDIHISDSAERYLGHDEYAV